MRILGTGSREFRDLNLATHALREVTAGQPGPHTLAQGGARGAGSILALTAGRLGWQVETYAAAWTAPCLPECGPKCRKTRPGGGTYCSAAGRYRNQRMVDLGADAAVALLQFGARNDGTRDCWARAVKARIPVHPYWGGTE